MNIIIKRDNGAFVVRDGKELFRVITSYSLEQVKETTFKVLGNVQVLSVKRLSEYGKHKFLLKDFATQWKYDFARFHTSYPDLLDYRDFFRKYGKRYGLLTEFKDLGII